MAPSNTQALLTLDLPNAKKIASGKVREIFSLPPPNENNLLFVATDRISAYDVIMSNGIPQKGALLTQISAFWFELFKSKIPELKTHLVSTKVPKELEAGVLEGRSMVVRKVEVIKLESIVRGYITGSAWAEYQKHGTVHGMSMPAGLKESQRLDQAIWTPSTKADAGEHDENISKSAAAAIVGADIAKRVEVLSLKIYEIARSYAEARGIIIADTKFEFGLDPTTQEIILIDEVLTPDSSRFWPKATYAVGKGQDSFDKQYLRNWLTSTKNKGKQGVEMPEEVVRETARKYREAFEMITGKAWGQ